MNKPPSALLSGQRKSISPRKCFARQRYASVCTPAPTLPQGHAERCRDPVTRNDDLHGCVTPTSLDVSKFYNNLHVVSALAHRSSLHGSIALELESLGSLLEH